MEPNGMSPTIVPAGGQLLSQDNNAVLKSLPTMMKACTGLPEFIIFEKEISKGNLFEMVLSNRYYNRLHRTTPRQDCNGNILAHLSA
jgi:hypothetical protein